MDTRQATLIPFLEKQPICALLGARLPTREEVFRFFYHLHYVKGDSIAKAAQTAVNAAKVFWQTAGLKTKHDRLSKNDLLEIHKRFKVSFFSATAHLYKK